MKTVSIASIAGFNISFSSGSTGIINTCSKCINESVIKICNVTDHKKTALRGLRFIRISASGYFFRFNDN